MGDEPHADLPPQDAEHVRLLGIFHYVLGVFTLVVLNRDSVWAAFEGAPPRAG